MRRLRLADKVLAAPLLPKVVAADDDRSHELTKEEQQTVALFQRCSNAVVHINTFISREKVLHGFGRELEEQGEGSGFLWDDNHIVTNYHVIMDADKATVTFADHSSHEAFLVGVEPDCDLAVFMDPQYTAWPTTIL
ncbi:unnamed protein product [Effrenium voratum]|nr:unnamed protein product [Effrenium voratum]